MSKIMVGGKARLEFPSEICQITITIKSSSFVSGQAITDGKQKTEKLLHTLQGIGIEPEDLMMLDEATERNYGDDKPYRFSKQIRAELPADQSLLLKVSGIFTELEDVSYRVRFLIADQEEKEQAALDAAIHDSRQKAEQIAASLGQRISGAEEVNFEHRDSIHHRNLAKSVCVDVSDDLAARLRNPVVEIEKEVNITWLTE